MSDIIVVLLQHPDDASFYDGVEFNSPGALKPIEAIGLLGTILYCLEMPTRIEVIRRGYVKLFSHSLRFVPRRCRISIDSEYGFFYEFMREPRTAPGVWAIIMGMIHTYGLAYPDRCQPDVIEQITNADPSRQW